MRTFFSKIRFTLFREKMRKICENYPKNAKKNNAKIPEKRKQKFRKKIRNLKKCKIPHEIYSDLMYRFKNNYKRQFI